MIKRRDRSPGACNGCSKHSHCRFDKFIYSTVIADKEYCAALVDARAGGNLTIPGREPGRSSVWRQGGRETPENRGFPASQIRSYDRKELSVCHISKASQSILQIRG